MPIDCPYCKTGSKHGTFVYMTTDRRYNPFDLSKQQTTPPYIAHSKHPLIHLKCLNRIKGYKTGSKASKQGAPYHQLQCLIGPFHNGEAKQAKQIIQKNARKTETRIIEMYKIAKEKNLLFVVQDKRILQFIKLK